MAPATFMNRGGAGAMVVAVKVRSQAILAWRQRGWNSQGWKP